jgi:hypothetical protein
MLFASFESSLTPISEPRCQSAGGATRRPSFAGYDTTPNLMRAAILLRDFGALFPE